MKKLIFGITKAFGRNHGMISSYHLESGHKKKYRVIDFFKNLKNVEGKVISIERDPYRSSLIAGVCYSNGIVAYQLHINKMKLGDVVGTKMRLVTMNNNKIGLSCYLKNVKEGEKIHNVEIFPTCGAKIARSAGTFVKLVKKYDKKNTGLLKLPSGEFRIFFLNCFCTIGRLSNISHKERIYRKAGVMRWLGRRPIVRGRAMNPVDHPHGGRTNGGIIPRTPWGKLTRGVKTAFKIRKYIMKKK